MGFSNRILLRWKGPSEQENNDGKNQETGKGLKKKTVIDSAQHYGVLDSYSATFESCSEELLAIERI